MSALVLILDSEGALVWAAVCGTVVAIVVAHRISLRSYI